jgi:hypothetical protein
VLSSHEVFQPKFYMHLLKTIQGPQIGVFVCIWRCLWNRHNLEILSEMHQKMEVSGVFT